MSIIFPKQYTNILKATLPLLIMLHHLAQKIDSDMLFMFKPLGAFICSIFFFITGYGIEISHLNKSNYINNFFSKRVSKVIIPFFISILFYQIYCFYFEGAIHLNTTTITDLLLKGMTNDILPASWFIFAILYFYVAFYISCLIKLKRTNNKYKYQTSILFLLLLIYILYCKLHNFGFYWYNSIFSFL